MEARNGICTERRRTFRAGIQPGDVVLAGAPVKDVGDLRSLVEKSGKNVALLVQRDDAKIFVPVNLG